MVTGFGDVWTASAGTITAQSVYGGFFKNPTSVGYVDVTVTLPGGVATLVSPIVAGTIRSVETVPASFGSAFGLTIATDLGNLVYSQAAVPAAATKDGTGTGFSALTSGRDVCGRLTIVITPAGGDNARSIRLRIYANGGGA